MMTQIALTLHSDGLSDSATQARLRQLAREIEARSDAKTELARGDATPGTKGDAVTIGTLLMTLMTSGAAVAALNVLKSWVEKDKTISFSLKRSDGTEISVNASNMEDAEKLVADLGGEAGEG
ncbi:hypothetical protein ACERZ8_15110 [Tateyamaria armeniaca]|uniref:Uncharacterized protein n=1 Tax=Tateyamaria armeniaca TaxID=2518930 RepID=A0ABW8UVH6_9RHOB